MNVRDAEVPREKPNLELDLDDEWETPLAPPPSSRPVPPASDTFPAEEPPTLRRLATEAELLLLRCV